MSAENSYTWSVAKGAGPESCDWERYYYMIRSSEAPVEEGFRLSDFSSLWSFWGNPSWYKREDPIINTPIPSCDGWNGWNVKQL